jgi:hypothetical protein
MHDVRLVWDCHDFVDTVGASSYDAIVVPSKGYARHFAGHNVHVVYSKVPECLLPNKMTAWGKLDAIALNATLCVDQPWGNYSDLNNDVEHLFVYASGDNVSGHEHLNIMRRLTYSKLLVMLSQYRYHWCGSANVDVTIHDCVTNKFWECLACGAMPLLRNSDEMQELYDDWDYVVPTMEHELPSTRAAYGILEEQI